MTPAPHRPTLLAAARGALMAGGTWPVDRLACHLGLLPGPEGLPTRWLDSALAADPMLWRLPDGRWLHLGAATWGRLFTWRGPEGGPPAGLLDPTPDLAAGLLTFRGWHRIPVRHGRARGFAEVLDGPAGRRRLVLGSLLVPSALPLLGLSPGPEGLRILAVDEDRIASARFRRRIEADLRRLRGTAGRAWSVLDLELAALVEDATLRRAATRPTSELIAPTVTTVADSA